MKAARAAERARCVGYGGMHAAPWTRGGPSRRRHAARDFGSKSSQRPQRVLVAIGGNSLVTSNSDNTFESQKAAVQETARGIAQLARSGCGVVVTHGNGPQVGFDLLRSEAGARAGTPPLPLDAIDAQTEGELGFLLQQAIHNELFAGGPGPLKCPVALITQVVVDSADPAFKKPTKPVGGYYDEDTARGKMAQEGWDMREDGARGWRRLVASPAPLEIVEQDAISALVEHGNVVICLGGGGIPVLRDERSGALSGIAAVIDKDASSAMLATALHCDAVIFSTGVPQICTDFGRPTERALARLTASEARELAEAGHFPAGSMGPKVEAALSFIKSAMGSDEAVAIITDPAGLTEALDADSAQRTVITRCG